VFKDTLNGWCVGTGGMVGKYNNSSVGISEGNTTVTNKSFNLYQNYPNPFNPRTKIKFDVIHPGSVKIIVYDIMGREIQTLVNKKLQSGTYETFFDGSLLTSGIYFYKLITDRFTETKKMLLMK
jgi:hypothetical protein